MEYNGTRYDVKKDIYSSLRAIKNINDEHVYETKLEGSPLNNVLASSLKNSEGYFDIKFYIRETLDPKYFKKPELLGIEKDIRLDASGYTYSINKNSTSNISISLSSPQIITLTVENFQTGINSDFDNKLLRLVIPTKIKPDLYAFECKRLLLDHSIYMCGLVDVKVKSYNYQIFGYENKDTEEFYLIIDSVEENTFNQFKEATQSILTAIGFITGNLYLDEYYYQVLRFDNVTLVDKTAFIKQSPSTITDISPFDPRRFSTFVEELKLKEKLGNIPIYLSSTSFSKICDKIYDNPTLNRTISFVLEAHETKLSLLKAGIFSIALETLTQIVYEENEEKINPLADKKLAKEIRKTLKEKLSEFKDQLSEYALKILTSKLDNLNKAPNSQKLAKPFEIYGLKLSKEDIKILNHRNKFLHGTSPFKENELKDKQVEISYISSKMIFLINCLILKYCGYSGHVVDFGAWHTYRQKKIFLEYPFRII